MKQLKRLSSLLIIFVLLMGVISPLNALAFADVSNGDEYSAAINTMNSLGVIGGMGDGTFRPDDLVTREQIAKILHILSNGTDGSILFKPTSAPFNDVSVYSWSAPYINWAKEMNIIQGTGNNNFSPTDNVTYAQMAALLIRTLGDDTAYDYPYGYVSRGQVLGLFDGIGNVANDAAVSRGEVAQMCYNALYAPMSGNINAFDENKALISVSFKANRATDMALLTEEFVITEASIGLVGPNILSDNQIYATPIKGTDRGEPRLFSFEGDATPFIGMKVYLWQNVHGEVIGIETSNSQRIYVTSPSTYKNDVADKSNVIIVDGATLEVPSGLEKKLETKDGNRYTLIDWDFDYDIDFVNTSTELIGQVSHYDGRTIQFYMSGTELTDGNNVTLGLIDLRATDASYNFNLPDGIKVGDVVSLNRGIDFGGANKKIAGYDVEILYPESKILNRIVPEGDENILYFNSEHLSNAYEVFPETVTEANYRLGETYSMYTNRNGYIVYSESDKYQEGATKGYLFIMEYKDGEAGALGFNAKIHAMLDDGTKQVFEISEYCPSITDVYSDKVFNSSAAGSVFAYAEDSTGQITNLQPIGTAEPTASFDADARLFRTEKYYVLPDDALIFTYDTDPKKVRLMDGKDIANSFVEANLATKNDGLNIEVGVVSGVLVEGGVGGFKIGFVKDFEKVMALYPGRIVGNFTLAIDGDVGVYNTYDVAEFMDTTGAEIQKNSYYIIELDESGNVISMNPALENYELRREVIVSAIQAGLIMSPVATWITGVNGDPEFKEDAISSTSGVFYPYDSNAHFYMIGTAPKDSDSGALSMDNGYFDPLPLTSFIREGVMSSYINDTAHTDYYYVAEYALNTETGEIDMVIFYIDTISEYTPTQIS